MNPSVGVRRCASVARVLAPRAGARLGGGRSVTLRWRATDADRDALTVHVEYSLSGGGTWRTVFVGPNHGTARLPASFLGRTTRAVIRVRANDGFNEAHAKSGRWRGPTAARGSAPARG